MIWGISEIICTPGGAQGADLGTQREQITLIIEFKILDNSELIFQALKTSSVLLTSVASATSVASTALRAQFPHKTS